MQKVNHGMEFTRCNTDFDIFYGFFPKYEDMNDLHRIIHSAALLLSTSESNEGRTDFHCGQVRLDCVYQFYFSCLLYRLFCFPFHFRYSHFAMFSFHCKWILLLLWPCNQFVQYAYNVISVISLFSTSRQLSTSSLCVNCWVR